MKPPEQRHQGHQAGADAAIPLHTGDQGGQDGLLCQADGRDQPVFFQAVPGIDSGVRSRLPQ